MPFIGYKNLAEIASSRLPEGRAPITEADVRDAKEAGQVNLDDFATLVEYVAGIWGWLPPGLGLDNLASLREGLKEAEEQAEAVQAELAKKDKTIARLEDEVARLTLINQQLDEAVYKPMQVTSEEHVARAESALGAARETLDAAMKRQGRHLVSKVEDNYVTPEDPYLARAKILRHPGGSK